MNPISDETLEKCGQHHNNQFGHKPLLARLAKMQEETGEVAGAVVRHLEQRDGRSWMSEIEDELGDVMVVLINLCSHLNISLSDLTERSVEKFLSRQWNIGDKTSERESS